MMANRKRGSLVATYRGMNGIPLQGLDEAHGLALLPGVLPGGDVAEVLVVALGLAVGILIFFAEMPAARLGARQSIARQQLAELHEVGDPARLLQGLVQVLIAARHIDALPEFVAQLADARERAFQGLLGARHADVV